MGAREKGARIAMRKHPSGFRIAFIHPDDFDRIFGSAIVALQSA
jgi:hypothetical protein